MEWLKSSDGPAVIVSNAVALMRTDAEGHELPGRFKGGKNKKMGEFSEQRWLREMAAQVGGLINWPTHAPRLYCSKSRPLHIFFHMSVQGRPAMNECARRIGKDQTDGDMRQVS
jgi:hypothetical protein